MKEFTNTAEALEYIKNNNNKTIIIDERRRGMIAARWVGYKCLCTESTIQRKPNQLLNEK